LIPGQLCEHSLRDFCGFQGLPVPGEIDGLSCGGPRSLTQSHIGRPEVVGLRQFQRRGRWSATVPTPVSMEIFSFQRNEAKIAEEAALDGIYVVRTSVEAGRLSSTEVVSSYKRLQQVERAFRIFNGELDVRPIHHRKAERVRAHPLICMLAHYVEWHMLRDLTPLLFAEEDLARSTNRADPVGPPVRSPRAAAKAATKRNEEGFSVHSFRSLLRDLATLTINRIEPIGLPAAAFDKVTTPTTLQRRALALLGVCDPGMRTTSRGWSTWQTRSSGSAAHRVHPCAC